MTKLLTALGILFAFVSPAVSAYELSASDFTELLVQGSIYDNPGEGFTYPFGHHVADINSDGDNDIVACDVFVEDRADSPNGSQISACYVFYGNGDGTFDREFMNIGSGFWEHVTSADLDNDGSHEVFAVNNRDGGAVMFTRDGSTRPWGQLLLAWSSTDMPRSYDIDAADLDADGCEDVVIGGYTGQKVIAYKNPCSGSVGQLGIFSPSILNGGYVIARTSRLADFNNDGKLDVLVTSEGNSVSVTPLSNTNPVSHGAVVKVLLNPGTITGTWAATTSDTNARGAGQAGICDLNGDGWLDFVVPYGQRTNLVPFSEHYIAVFINNQNQTFTKSKIKDDQGTVIPIHYAIDADCGDIDGDGWAEIVYAAHDSGSDTDDDGDRVGILEPDGSGGWTDVPLKTEWTAANDVTIADINGDGNPDIVGTADNGNGDPRREGGSEIRVWINDH